MSNDPNNLGVPSTSLAISTAGDDLIARLEAFAIDKAGTIGEGWNLAYEAAARIRELEAEPEYWMLRAERAEAERDAVQHLFAQHERHRDELLLENEQERIGRARDREVAIRMDAALRAENERLWALLREIAADPRIYNNTSWPARIDAALAGEKP